MAFNVQTSRTATDSCFLFPFSCPWSPGNKTDIFFHVAFKFHINWIALLELRISRKGQKAIFLANWRTAHYKRTTESRKFRRDVIVIHDLRLEWKRTNCVADCWGIHLIKKIQWTLPRMSQLNFVFAYNLQSPRNDATLAMPAGIVEQPLIHRKTRVKAVSDAFIIIIEIWSNFLVPLLVHDKLDKRTDRRILMSFCRCSRWLRGERHIYDILHRQTPRIDCMKNCV